MLAYILSTCKTQLKNVKWSNDFVSIQNALPSMVAFVAVHSTVETFPACRRRFERCRSPSDRGVCRRAEGSRSFCTCDTNTSLSSAATIPDCVRVGPSKRHAEKRYVKRLLCTCRVRAETSVAVAVPKICRSANDSSLMSLCQ